jgi:two-component system chemotaxis response regulator CheB
MSLRVLVVDDSATFGRVIKQALESIAGVEVIKLCRGGRAALDYMQGDAPDLVTLDIEMPDMNGLEVLQAMRRQAIKTPVAVVSAASERARNLTIRALALGALEVVPKPEGAGGDESLAALRERLGPLVSAAAHRKTVESLLRGANGPATAGASVPRPRMAKRAKPAMVLIGVSTGGPEALSRLIPKLPATLAVPVLIVQHMPPLFTQSLAAKLDSCSALRVKEASEGEIARAGHVYIAPGGSHLKVAAGALSEIILRITSDPPENNCRPAADTLFRSAALAFPGRSVAVILTGMGRDGTLGLRLLKASGCVSIAQDEASCVVFGMPKEAINAGVVDVVAPLDTIASEITKAVA